MSIALDAARPRSVTAQAVEAIASAYEESLYKGLTVVVTEVDELVERQLDGARRVLKNSLPFRNLPTAP